MMKIYLQIVVSLLLMASTLLLAVDLPAGYPTKDGRDEMLVEVDTNNYTIIAGGLRYTVARNAKIVNKYFKKIFLFQLKPGMKILLIKDETGKVVEIWELPENHQLTPY